MTSSIRKKEDHPVTHVRSSMYGVDSYSPVASSDTEEGRAKN